MGLSFPNPIKAAQNFASGVQRTVSNGAQNLQRTAAGAVQTVQHKAGEAQSFLNRQVNNVKAQAQGAQRQVNSLANKAQRSLNNAVQSNIVRPVQQAQRQASSTIHKAQNRFNNEVQSRVVKPLQQTQHKVEKSLSNTKHLIERNAQQLHKNFDQSVHGTQKKIGQTLNAANNNIQKNVVKPLQQTQRNVEQNLNNTKQQIERSAQQLHKNFDQSVQGAQKTINQKIDSVQKQLNQGLEGKKGYEQVSQRMDNVFKVSEKVGDKLAHFNQVGGVPNSLTHSINVAGEAMKTATDLSKGIGSLINGAPKWASSVGDLASGKEGFSKKEAAAAVFRSVSNLGYGMVTGAGDLLAKVATPGGGRDIYSKATKDVHQGLSDSYEKDAKKLGLNPNSKTSKTVEQFTDVVGTAATFFIPGAKGKGGALVKTEQAAAGAERAISMSEATANLSKAVKEMQAGKAGAADSVNSALSKAQEAYKTQKGQLSPQQLSEFKRAGVQANQVLSKAPAAEKVASTATNTAERAGAKATTAQPGTSAAKGGNLVKAEPGGKLEKLPTVSVFGFQGGGKPALKILQNSPLGDAAGPSKALKVTGHVGYSFNNGSTIHGFNPDVPSVMKAHDAVKSLSKGTPYPGKITNDTSLFQDVAKPTPKNNHVTPAEFNEMMNGKDGFWGKDKPSIPQNVYEVKIQVPLHDRMSMERNHWAAGSKPMNDSLYAFPNKYTGGIADNCATFPHNKLGLPGVEGTAIGKTGVMQDLMLDFRQHGSMWTGN